MAVTINMEFTDEQWSLIKEHFKVKVLFWEDCESVSDYINEIKRHTNEKVQDMIQEKQAIEARKNQSKDILR